MNNYKTTTNNIMTRTIFLVILIGLFTGNIKGQISFSSVDSKLQKLNNELICSSSATKLTFPLKQQITDSPQNNFVTIDSQIIQIMTLKFDGYKKDSLPENPDKQKELLDIYSNYELAYFKNTLGIEVINANSQWVVIKSKGWLIWYFRVGNIPTQVNIKSEIQLFATTVIEDNILIINAPIMTSENFLKAGLIVNELMEVLTISKK